MSNTTAVVALSLELITIANRLKLLNETIVNIESKSSRTQDTFEETQSTLAAKRKLVEIFELDYQAIEASMQRLLDIDTTPETTDSTIVTVCTPTPRFAIGTEFRRRGKKVQKIETVSDYLFTFNGAGEFVKMRYVVTHDFMGQTMKDSDVIETTIAMGLVDKSLLNSSE